MENQRKAEGRLQRTLRCALPAIFCNLLWGSAIPFINVGYRLFDIQAGDTGSQLLFAGCRFLLAGILTVVFRSLTLRRAALPSADGWRKAGILSLFQTVGQYLFFYIGVANTASVNASIIQGLNAFVSILMAVYVFRYEKMSPRKALGGVLGVLGIVVVNLGGSVGDLRLEGEGFLLLSMVSGAASAGLIKRFGRREDPVTLSGWQFILGSLALILAGLLTGGRLSPNGAESFGVLGYLAFLSAAAYGLWSVLLKKYPVSRVAVYMFLQPLFGVALGVLLVRQELTRPLWQYALALALVSLSIWMVNRGERSADEKRAETVRNGN